MVSRWARIGLEFACAAPLTAHLLDAPQARACGSCFCPGQQDTVGVAFEARDAPLNLRLWLDLKGADPTQVTFARTSDQSAVPFDLVKAAPGSSGYWLQPRSLLEPQTAYSIGFGNQGIAFTTGDAVNERAPELGRVRIESGTSTSLCTDIEGGFLAIDSIKDLGLPGSSVVVEVRAGDAQAFIVVAGTTIPQRYPIGTGDAECLGSALLTGLTRGTTVPVKVTAWDTSGHATVVENLELTPAQVRADACGGGANANETCDATGGLPRSRHGVLAGWFALLCAVAIRRRERQAR